MKLRTVRYNGGVYLRVDDVKAMLEEFGASEETDVRNRTLQLIENINTACQAATKSTIVEDAMRGRLYRA